MSLVGTRPILQDELLKYELHHRARIAIKPGKGRLEMLQLLLRLGTFQLSDIFYNTVGGVLGGLMYCAVMKARKRL